MKANKYGREKAIALFPEVGKTLGCFFLLSLSWSMTTALCAGVSASVG